jgi:hypothetical protein
MVIRSSLVLGLAVIAVASSFGCAASSADESAASSDQHLTGAVNPVLAKACGGGAWESTATFDGIAGSYERTNHASSGALVAIRFDSVAPGVGSRVTGLYSLTREGGATSAGTFEALPDNAAFESSFFLSPAGAMPDVYYALALKRAASGEISELCIEHPVGVTDAPILLKRTVPAAAAAEAGTGANPDE